MSTWSKHDAPIRALPLNDADTPAQPSRDGDPPWLLGVVSVLVTWGIGVVSGLAIAHMGWIR